MQQSNKTLTLTNKMPNTYLQIKEENTKIFKDPITSIKMLQKTSRKE